MKEPNMPEQQEAMMRSLGAALSIMAGVSQDDLLRVADAETSSLARAVMNQLYEHDNCPPFASFDFKVKATGSNGHVEELTAWYISSTLSLDEEPWYCAGLLLTDEAGKAISSVCSWHSEDIPESVVH